MVSSCCFSSSFSTNSSAKNPWIMALNFEFDFPCGVRGPPFLPFFACVVFFFTSSPLNARASAGPQPAQTGTRRTDVLAYLEELWLPIQVGFTSRLWSSDSRSFVPTRKVYHGQSSRSWSQRRGWILRVGRPAIPRVQVPHNFTHFASFPSPHTIQSKVRPNWFAIATSIRNVGASRPRSTFESCP